jgi:hypothetical protein
MASNTSQPSRVFPFLSAPGSCDEELPGGGKVRYVLRQLIGVATESALEDWESEFLSFKHAIGAKRGKEAFWGCFGNA